MLNLYNTLSHKIEKFQPLKKNAVGMYTCGPTVYNYAHIGNLRSFVFEDILKRALSANGFRVKHIMNLTDVDDKTIKASQAAKQTLKAFTAFYTHAFKKDIRKLNILPPAKFAPATRYIKQMMTLVQNLLKKGMAYEKNGSIYFCLAKFPNYGSLARLSNQELKIGARVEADNYDKDNPADFVLWKKWTPKDGKVFWKTPLGKGRPGWHLECSAISVKELGQPIDIHAGGVDLIFPHHENEIAQSEAAFGKQFVRFWIHGEHLLVENQKMAKSLNNFFTLQDLETRDFNPLAFRYLLLTAHYRSKLNFTLESLQGARNALNNLYEIIRAWDKPKIGCAEFEQKFIDAINNDLNTPEALAVLWNLVKSDYPTSAKAATLLKFDKILGLDFIKYLGKKEKIPVAVNKLLAERVKARQEKNWQRSDELRKKIEESGYSVEDTPQGQKILKS
ncbi:MAG: cysteine--tRNA ligase [Candidatus Magasanikbacteria bacterium]|nr:cysteine--tRNA ligase [Candidatus Magasanikbacteria bacterium]